MSSLINLGLARSLGLGQKPYAAAPKTSQNQRVDKVAIAVKDAVPHLPRPLVLLTAQYADPSVENCLKQLKGLAKARLDAGVAMNEAEESRRAQRNTVDEMQRKIRTSTRAEHEDGHNQKFLAAKRRHDAALHILEEQSEREDNARQNLEECEKKYFAFLLQFFQIEKVEIFPGFCEFRAKEGVHMSEASLQGLVNFELPSDQELEAVINRAAILKQM